MDKKTIYIATQDFSTQHSPRNFVPVLAHDDLLSLVQRLIREYYYVEHRIRGKKLADVWTAILESVTETKTSDYHRLYGTEGVFWLTIKDEYTYAIYSCPYIGV